MKRTLTYEKPLVEVISPLPTGLLCASNVDPGGLEIPFPGFNPENKW